MIDPALVAAAVAEVEAEQRLQRPYPDQDYLAMALREAEFERQADARLTERRARFLRLAEARAEYLFDMGHALGHH